MYFIPFFLNFENLVVDVCPSQIAGAVGSIKMKGYNTVPLMSVTFETVLIHQELVSVNELDLY